MASHGKRGPVRRPPDEALSRAVEAHRAGRLREAERGYRRLLRAVPDQPDALHFLGVLLHQSGRSPRGVAAIRRAIERSPDHPGMHNNLGNVLEQTGDLHGAEAAYRRALELEPGWADAHHNLGVVLRQRGRRDEALAAYDRALALDPERPDTHANRGNVLRTAGRLEEAAQAYARAVELDRDHARALTNLGQVLSDLGRTDEAATLYRRWLDRQPDHPIARHMLAACSGRGVPERADDAYVERVFDNLAEDFDHHLGQLDYRAPELLLGALAGELPAPRRELRVLDAGCGTGWCGPLLRPYARRLEGVDLSSRMLAHAERRAAYDELVRAELTAFLAARPRAYDLIVSADTLVYFGALEPVLAAAARALAPGGTLAFTVERSADRDPTGFRLQPHGRYSHARAYLERALAAAGLDLRLLRAEVPRREAGEPVPGWLVLARAPAGS